MKFETITVTGGIAVPKEPEIWTDIKGYEGLYQISNHGRVKSLARTIKRGGIYQDLSEKVLKPQYARQYLFNCLSKNGIKKTWLLHRLVAIHFIKNPDVDKYDQVNHFDCVKTNNYYLNLEWTDRKGNAQHAVQNFRMPWQYSQEIIDKIEAMCDYKTTAGDIAKRLNIPQRTVTEIIQKRGFKKILRKHYAPNQYGKQA